MGWPWGWVPSQSEIVVIALRPTHCPSKGVPSPPTKGVMCDTITAKVEPESAAFCCHMPHGRRNSLGHAPPTTFSPVYAHISPTHTHTHNQQNSETESRSTTVAVSKYFT